MSKRTQNKPLLPAMLLLLLASATVTAEAREANPFRLKDGSILVVDPAGNMTMLDAYGNPVKMEDGVLMDMEDGTVIMMKNNQLWQKMKTPPASLKPEPMR